METIRLSPRLQAAADFVLPGRPAADVGTDHGYLPVYLRQNGVCDSVIASDIAPAPLESARASARKYDVDGVDFRLCPGLEGIRQAEADTVVIAGMSGETMITILEAANWDWTGKRLVLQPMTKRAELLMWLYTHGLHVEAETFAEEGEKQYWILCVEAGERPMPRKAHLWAGFTETDYAMKLAWRLRRALMGLKKAETPDEAQMRELRSILEDMDDAYGWTDICVFEGQGPAGTEAGL